MFFASYMYMHEVEVTNETQKRLISFCRLIAI